MSRGNKPPGKDMYWFAHGGADDKNPAQKNNALAEDDDVHGSGSPTWNSSGERKGSPDDLKSSLGYHHTVLDGSSSSGPSSLEREDRLRASDKRVAVEERRKQLWEAEQERNDAVLKKHMEREAAMEARRNAQRSNIAFAFGSSVPRNVETLHANEAGDFDSMSRSFTTSGLSHREENHTFHDRRSVSPLNSSGNTFLVDDLSHRPNSSQSCTSYSERKIVPPSSWLVGSGALIGDDIMSKSMHAAMPCASRGRRKNDLMPTIPYERNPNPRPTTTSSTRKRSVSMTRLDQLAQPRRHYVEANKANSTASSGASSMLKDSVRSPTRPLSSASEHSGGSGRVPGTVTRRVRSSPRKPRPVSIAGTIPDSKLSNAKTFEAKVSPVKRSYTPSKRTAEPSETKKTGLSVVKTSTPKSTEKVKPTPRPTTAPKLSTPKSTVPKPSTLKSVKQTEVKQSTPKSTAAPKPPSPKVKEKKPQTIKKKTDVAVSSPLSVESKEITDKVEKPSESSPPQEEDSAENERNNAKRIISEEEAKAALAEKRRLAREQAEREAELERQRQEELRREEEERLRKEEEEQRKMEEEQLRLLEEHRRLEDEKLRKAIEEQEQKEEEERAKRDEELRLKAEQERKAKEEAEKQRLELEEKLRKEEEERAERKKRLEKIMSRTRGKSSGTSPSGSVSGSDQLDSAENPHEGFSSGANSLDSNETNEIPSEPVSVDENLKAEISSTVDSMENNPTYEIGSENESLNSNDLMMPVSETASQDNSLVIIPEKNVLGEEFPPNVDASPTVKSSDHESHNIDSVSSPHLFENEEISEISVPASPCSTELPTTALVKNVDMLPPQSQDVPNENVEADILFLSSTDPALNIQSENLEKEALHITSDIKSFIHDDVQNVSNSDSDKVNDVSESDLEKKSELLEEKVCQEDLKSVELNENIEREKAETFSSENVDTRDAFSSYPYDLANKEDSNVDLAISSDSLEVGYPVETEFSDFNTRISISSDFKLPDPIYETSDEGSISSEKQLHDFKISQQEELNEARNFPASDDVFSEQTAEIRTEFIQKNPFGENDCFSEPNPFAEHVETDVIQKSVHDNQGNFSDIYDMNESVYEAKESPIIEDAPEEHHDGEGEIIAPPESSPFTVTEESAYPSELISSPQDVNPFNQDIQSNKENIQNENFNDIPSQFTSGNNGIGATEDTYDIYSNKENMFTQQTSYSDEIMQSGDGPHNLGSAFDNPFVAQAFSDIPTYHQFESGDSNAIHAHSSAVFEKVSELGKKPAEDSDQSSKREELSDVTYIKDDGSGACIGIISSIEHDHASNDFTKDLHNNEQLKNNFQYNSVTDSEESSLDSNLSQVMTVDNSEKDTIGGLNHVENSIVESNSSNLVYSNGEQQHDNPFAAEPIYNHGTISQTNGSNFSASEVFSNGHGLQSSTQSSEEIGELHGYMQLEGSNILSVDHSKSNMYENVDAMDYSKVSPDSFLPKGNSKQISGNPFLLQDDQKQVLMSPDFLN